MTEQETNYFLNKPVDKNLQKAQDITFMWSMSNCTIYEKVVLTELILHEGPSTPKEIAFRMGISEASARRAVKSLKESGICINHPKVDGVIINDIVFW
jgi:predicted transcriptional regulator